ncbi:MAG: hypothetical protein HY332_16875 [Chloroflexi bacterium]|nr:hypothetical protein [Chloroflexota bacterium]
MASVTLVQDPNDQTAAEPPVQQAIAQLRAALAGRGVTVQVRDRLEGTDQDTLGALSVVVAGPDGVNARTLLERAGVSPPSAPEWLALVPGSAGGQRVVLAAGRDVRGLVYAVLELADRVEHVEGGTDPLGALRFDVPTVEQPANAVRSVMRLFASDVEDKAWFYDRECWTRYLAMLVAQRFNRINLALGLSYDFPRRVRDSYLYFAYPFLVSVPGYDVRVTGLAAGERERNLDTLRSIAGEAKARGLHFQLGIWTHAYQLVDSPEVNHTIEGLTPETHAAYCRDALRTLLEACPSIDGLTFRIHGESGVPEESFAFWKTVFDGAVQSGRRLELDLHAKGIDERMIDTALSSGLPVNVSPKYWAEHMGPPYHQAWIRPNEQSRRPGNWEQNFMALSAGSRRFTRYGYADLLREDREYGIIFRIWPGTQRLLLWGDPAMAAGFGRSSHFCGALGTELFEPLSFKGRRGSGLPGPRGGYADESLRPAGGDWEKYRYTYRLFGRLLYNPQAQPDTWRRAPRSEFGAASGEAEAALTNASRILPLVTVAHLPSAANNTYWPEIYTNMPIVGLGPDGAPEREGDEVRRHPYGDTPSPKRFGTVSPLDPELFCGVDDFADELLAGKFSGACSPLDVVAALERFAGDAEQHLAQARVQAAEPNAPAVRRLVVDVTIQCGIGRFFAHKFRAAVGYALFRRTGNPTPLREALAAYRAARDAWAAVAGAAGGVYVDDLTFGPEPHLRGHWRDRLPAVDQDIADMAALLERAESAGTAGRPATDGRRPIPVDASTAVGRRSSVVGQQACAQTPLTSFRRGEPVPLLLAIQDAGAEHRPIEVCLHYRHVNQAEPFEFMTMESDGASGGLGRRFQATIPAAYSDSPYPLQYFFTLHASDGLAWMYPGFEPDFSNQPYFVVRQKF